MSLGFRVKPLVHACPITDPMRQLCPALQDRLCRHRRSARWICPLSESNPPRTDTHAWFYRQDLSRRRLRHACHSGRRRLVSARRFAGLALPLSFGLEGLQAFAPGRGVHIADSLANVAGVAIGLLLLIAVGRLTIAGAITRTGLPKEYAYDVLSVFQGNMIVSSS